MFAYLPKHTAFISVKLFPAESKVVKFSQKFSKIYDSANNIFLPAIRKFLEVSRSDKSIERIPFVGFCPILGFKHVDEIVYGRYRSQINIVGV